MFNIIREMHIKITKRYHFILSSINVSKMWKP